MGNGMYNDEQLAHAEIVQKEAEEALARWDSLPVTHRYDYEAAEVIRSFRALLAALPERVLPDGRYECHCCGAPIIPGGVVFCAECYHASVTVWKSCPHYTAGERHTGCETCGGFGAVPEEPAVDRAAAPGPCINGMPDCPHEGTHYHRKNEGETWGRVYFDDEVTRAFDRLRSQPDETAAACRRNWGTGAGLRAEGKP